MTRKNLLSLDLPTSAAMGALLHASGTDVLLATGGQIQRDALYTKSQVAAILHIPESSLMRWSKEANGPKVTRLFVNAPVRFRGCHILKAMEASLEVMRSGRVDDEACNA